MSRSGLSSQMAEMRASIEKDSQLGSLMAGLRGSNMNSSDFAEDGVVMQLVAVEADEAEQLPLVYNPDAIAAFWSRRPIAVARRVVQLLRLGWPLVAGLAWDLAWGRLQVMAGGCMPPLGSMCCLLGWWCALRGTTSNLWLQGWRLGWPHDDLCMRSEPFECCPSAELAGCACRPTK